MISCTEFIPAYSEGFKFLKMKSSQEEPEKFWSWLSGIYLNDSLARLVSDKGLEGCIEYWGHSLNEEAADFTMKLNEIQGEFTIEMHRCPSKAMLNEMPHMVPFKSYCSHCSALYRPVVKKNGYDYKEDLKDISKASCRLTISINGKTNFKK